MIELKFDNGSRKLKFGIPFGFILSGFFFMLLMGILHHEIHPVIPPIGYGLSVLIMFMVQLIGMMHTAGE